MNQVSNFNSYNEKKRQVLIYDDHITSEQKFVSVTYKYYFLFPTPQLKSKIVLLSKHSQTFMIVIVNHILSFYEVTSINETPRGKTKNVVSEQIQHKPGSTSTADG